MTEFKLPTENIKLPSKGLLYPLDSPLSSGEIEMRYMSAKEEDILTNRNYLQNGTVFHKLLQSLIVDSNINIDNLLLGDQNALLINSRILGYGANYPMKFYNEETGKDEVYEVDLNTLKDKEVDYSLFKNRENYFEFTLPKSKNVVGFKLLTVGDEKKIEQEIKGLNKLNPKVTYDISTRLKHMIQSINGNLETKTIRNFVDKELLAIDAKALREYYDKIMPNIELKTDIITDTYTKEGVGININLDFFWPESRV